MTVYGVKDDGLTTNKSSDDKEKNELEAMEVDDVYVKTYFCFIQLFNTSIYSVSDLKQITICIKNFGLCKTFSEILTSATTKSHGKRSVW